jgi:hypothetical protein
MKRSIEPWVPAAFCAFISFMALFASIGDGEGWWRPTFFAFLPMCFIFVGGAILRMQREIRELRLRLSEVTATQLAATVPVREKR